MDDGAPADQQPAARFPSTGKAEFVEELLSRYVGKVYGMIDLMLANQPDAEDLTQEVLVRARRSRRGRGPLPGRVQGSWLTDGEKRGEIVAGRRMKP